MDAGAVRAVPLSTQRPRQRGQARVTRQVSRHEHDRVDVVEHGDLCIRRRAAAQPPSDARPSEPAGLGDHAGLAQNRPAPRGDVALGKQEVGDGEGGHEIRRYVVRITVSGTSRSRVPFATMRFTGHMVGSASVTPETPPPPRDQPAQVPSSPELFATVSTGIEMCYRTFGDPADEPMLLLMGLASPLIWWDPAFCSMLADRGYYVITTDNRDVGRSTKVRGRVTRRMLVRAYSGLGGEAPYSMSDMAADEFALLDHLDIERAHVVGVSMGGMIAQTMAVDDPARVRSLTSIMSTTGGRTVGWSHPRLLPALLRP